MIERSSDGNNFSSAGNRMATSFTQTFFFYDMLPLAGINYYRLKKVEDNGNISYSPVISLASPVKELQVSTRPNYITDGTANLYFQPEKAMQATTIITDASGRIVVKKAMNIPVGAGTFPLNVSELAKGIYQLTLQGNG